LYIPAIPNDASETENTEKDKAKGRNTGRLKFEKAIGDSNAKNFLFTQRSLKIFLQINKPNSSSILNTVFWCIPLFILVFAKAAVSLESWTKRCSRILNAVAENWIWVNNLNQRLVAGNTRWDVQGMGTLHDR
jgi:hypothetical protein